MKSLPEALRLYAVTDRGLSGAGRVPAAVEEAVLGGATMVQLREKELRGEELLAEARAVGAVCRRHGVPFVVNDFCQVAAAAEADGVHLGQGDGSVIEARRLLGPQAIIGVSAQTPEQARRAYLEGADYLGVGALFPTATKADAEAVSPETLAAICAATPLPVVGIGGISLENLASLSGRGLAGVALVSALFGRQDVRSGAAEFRRQISKYL